MDQLYERLLAWEVLAPLVAASVLIIGTATYLTLRRNFNSSDQRHDNSALSTNFRELHERGVLSDDEYRTIKTRLVDRAASELKDSEEKG